MKSRINLKKAFSGIVSIMLFMGCGTHGSIKGYRYPTTKDNLEKAVMTVIKNNPNINRDTSFDYLGSSPALDSLNSSDRTRDFSAGDNYYNDIKHYVTIEITSRRVVYSYTFRYYGGDEDWNTDTSSMIFICYAYDREGHGGSKGNGGVTRWNAKGFTEIFEKEFVNKIDKALSMTHTDSD